MMNVLITGAAGFIGRYVAKEFSKRGYEVLGMGWGEFPDHHLWGISHWQECEVTLETLSAFANQPDVIVHCAGGSAVGYSLEHPREDFCLTVETTSHVLEYIRVHSPKSLLLYPSSAAVYGQVKHVPILESTALSPISPYGVHKRVAEQLCQMYAEKYNVSIAIVRLFSIYGEGLRKQLLWDACQKFKQGDYSFFGTGEEVRDWLHVIDVANLFYKAVKHASPLCPIVNAGSGKGVKIRDILTRVSCAMEVIQPLEFSATPKEGDPNVYIADVKEIEAWGWKPDIDWYAGVDDYVRWYRSCQ